MVVLDGSWDRIGRGEDADAARRLYYVAMTRARQTLTLMRLPGPQPFQDALSGAPTTLLRSDPVAHRRRRRNWRVATNGSACATSSLASRGTGILTILCTKPSPRSRPETPCGWVQAATGGTCRIRAVWSSGNWREASRLPLECGAFPRPFWRSSTGTGKSRSRSTGMVFAARPGRWWCRSWCSSLMPDSDDMLRARMRPLSYLSRRKCQRARAG